MLYAALVLLFAVGQELAVGGSPAQLQGTPPERPAGGGQSGVGPPLAALPYRPERQTQPGPDGDAAGRPVSLGSDSPPAVSPVHPLNPLICRAIVLQSDQFVWEVCPTAWLA